jgi:hypothetical protein
MNNYPKLHNAMWPGLVGKGPGAEPFIDLDTMLELTVSAESDGVRFDGVDLFLADPHTSIDSTDDQVKALADKIASKSLAVGSVVAPVWPRREADPRWGPQKNGIALSNRSGSPAKSPKSCANLGSDRPESSALIPRPILSVG